MNFLNSEKRIIGTAVPLFALRDSETSVCGEFPSLKALGDLAKDWNLNLIQLLPVNDTGTGASPYSALSAFALHPVYIRIEDISWKGSAASKEKIASMLSDFATRYAGNKRVPFDQIVAEKLAILREIWNSANPAPMKRIEAFIKAQPWVKPYACFVAMKSRNQDKPWWEWREYRNPTPENIEKFWSDPAFSNELFFHAWVQMIAKEQFAEACRYVFSLGIDIMGDIPILLNKDSADVWFERRYFNLDFSAGAPPDMYSALGQNWGFPLYRWDAIEASGFVFWKNRLAYADVFYSSYRIDHVLGFFRIWGVSNSEIDAFLGRFIPEYTIEYHELAAMGFDQARITWLSKPHIPASVIDEALSSLSFEAALQAKSALFSQIGSEPLYRFNPAIHGGKDIQAILGDGEITGRVLSWWRNRTLYEVEPGKFVPSWEYSRTTAWGTLSENEKHVLEALFARRKGESLTLWENTGKKILGMVSGSVKMQACAEDLGAVPPCVPAVLDELGIPGLRVLRWHRKWDEAGAPFVPLADYPVNAVACPSVHDSSNIRQWWEEEADKQTVWDLLCKAMDGDSAKDTAAPEKLEPADMVFFLQAFATVASRFAVIPLQDLLACDVRYREQNPADERINIPGTMLPGNWVYRMKPSLAVLRADSKFSAVIREISKMRQYSQRGVS
ncbi:MAG: 4-alpha-glucanotransferase [Spirochaetia bacterium]|nr:4-alpha-glucanotransferase [Spirochaetia bacterium]